MEDIFLKIYDKHYLDVYRLSYSYLLNKEDAEDVTQNTFIKLYHNPEILKNNDEVIIKWLFRVAINNSKNNLLNFWHKKKVSIDNLDFISNESNHNLYLSLNELPFKYRIPIYLYYYEGYQVKEIASIMKIKESTIKSRLLRGKKILRIEMEKES